MNKKINFLSLLFFIAIFLTSIFWTQTSLAASESTLCAEKSNFTLSVRNYHSYFVSGLKFELYEQGVDANGLPTAERRVGSGKTDDYGQGSFSFKPDSGKLYALKIYDRSANSGEFWFFGVTRFVCGYDRYVKESIPALNIVLRDSKGNLKRNYSFSLYPQKYDADNKPFFQKSDRIANLKTDGGGQATIYLAPYNPYRYGQSGSYVLSTRDSDNNPVAFYNIEIPSDRDYDFTAKFSGLSGELADAQGRLLTKRNILLYPLNINDQYRLIQTRTDERGRFSFEYPRGRYRLVNIDDFRQENSLGEIDIKGNDSYQKLTTSAISFEVDNSPLDNNISVSLYSLLGSGGQYYRGKKIASIRLNNAKSIPVSLAEGPYLVTYIKDKQEFGRTFYARNASSYNVHWNTKSKYLLSPSQKFTLTNSSQSNSLQPQSLAKRLKGRILLQVEDKGQAWYVNPVDDKRYYLGRPRDAFNLMRQVSLGISNSDFSALETNPHNWQSLLGRILLKTADQGRAYYFNPVDYKLYYLGRPQDAFNVMREQGLGITNVNLQKILLGVN